MDNPVNIFDIEARYRAFAEEERPNAQALLDDAWEELQARVPTMAARAAAGLITTGLIRRVVAAMVRRVLLNPEAIRQWSVDDGTFVRDSALSSGLLYALPEEIALLTGVPVEAPGHVSVSASMGYGRR